MGDGLERMFCPFDNAHYILRSRMAKHIMQCKKNHPNTNLQCCPFNQIHWVPVPELDYHMEVCEDRKQVERVVYQVGPTAKKVDDLIVKSAPTDVEDWSADCCESYLVKRPEVIAKRGVYCYGELNVGKAARREHLLKEKARHQELADLAL